MAAPTLFKRVVLAQVAAALALVAVFGVAFYVERNRTIARLMAERWAPALRAAAGIDVRTVPTSSSTPTAQAVRVLATSPPQSVRTRSWAPRIAVLRETLREEGLPVGDVVFTATGLQPTTWLEVTTVDGRVRWLGFDDDVVQTHVFGRLAFALVLGLLVLASASWFVARRVARPLETLRRRMEAQDWRHAGPDGEAPRADPASTLEIDAIESAWLALGARLERQESERALMLAGVSHDLRGPLARIRMAAELLPEVDGVAARRASIVRNVEVADRLIDSFLDYVRASELPLTDTVDVAALAHRLRQLRHEPEDVLSIVAPQRLDVPHAHELLIERLIGNLVDNALRHGKPPVCLRIALDQGRALVAVEDRGAGIAIAERSRMTQAFARGDASRGTPGTGLGLAIVQQIVRRMGGTLSFDSPDGVQRVCVHLPLQ